MAEGYYKLAVNQTYNGQALVNVYYYGDGGGVPFAAPVAAQGLEIADALADRYVAQLAAAWPTTWSLDSVSVSFVDRRAVVDPAFSELTLARGDLGTSVDLASDGQWNTAIVAFNGVVPSGASRLVKRSYVAIGPMMSVSVASGGQLQGAQAAALTNLANDLQTNLTTGSFGAAYPVRIGRTVDPAPIAITSVTFATVRPFVSTRASRKTRPTGV